MDRAAKSILFLVSFTIAACGGSSGPKTVTCPPGQHDGGDGTCVALGACSTGYHDGGGGLCLPDVACATGYHDGGGGVCVPNGACLTGYHDGGGGKCTATGICATGYSLASDGTCVKSATCAAGTHDNGAGVCVADSTCPTGYHDGGTGTCVPTGACSSGYHDGGSGDCTLSGTCSSGYHDGGMGSCVPLVACSANYHDGGDGVCVRDGWCSPGYHDGGDGRCLMPGECSMGYHNGGGGECWPAGLCAPGYDLDGTGQCAYPAVAGSGGTTGATVWPDASLPGTGAVSGAGGVAGSGGVVGAGGALGTGGVVGAGGVVGGGGSGGTSAATITETTPSICGNGKREGNETCDDGNTVSGDGCSADCGTIEDGYECRVPGKRCSPKCGDSKLIGGENCDDGNSSSGDGCSSTCQVEPGADCPTLGKPCVRSVCGNGKLETGELCDCGTDPNNLPSGCKGTNGLFYGDGKGCSNTCTKEPICQDASGKTQACTTACGDGNVDPGEDCDDGNLVDGDGCSSACKIEAGFTCATSTVQVTSTCQSGSGQCLELPIIYRDFQPENVASGGHPDFPFLGTRYGGSTAPTTICVPNSGGPAKGNDSTARCWGIVGTNLLNGKPQPGSTTTCACQFSDWSIANSSRISGGYTQAANDSPLSDGNGSYQGGSAGSAVNTTSSAGTYTGTVTGYTSSSPGGPIWKGTVPAYKDANSLKQWWSDDASVNKTFTAVLELPSIGSNIYQYASRSHLAQGGFFPLDTLNPSQATLCNLFPYWNHGNGNPFWTTCTGDQYLFLPRVMASDCVSGDTVDDGCWVTSVSGQKHDFYFTDEARFYFVYDGTNGISLSFYGDDDLFIFINGVQVLDLGGVHAQLPGKVTVSGSPGNATVTEGGCLDTAGNITGASTGSTACGPSSGTRVPAASPDDFRTRTVSLGLATGKVYELAIFGADRHPPESNFQLTLQGFTTKRSTCMPRCGDGVVSGGEECDCGDDQLAGTRPAGCLGPNKDGEYGGCSTQCKFGPFCGDGITSAPEQCDLGTSNGGAQQPCGKACQLVGP